MRQYRADRRAAAAIPAGAAIGDAKSGTDTLVQAVASTPVSLASIVVVLVVATATWIDAITKRNGRRLRDQESTFQQATNGSAGSSSAR